MSTRDQAPPEGALIRLARKARGLSVNKAVKLVQEAAPDMRLGVSRWYHIESGTEGKSNPVVAPPETIAHMANAVGLTPDRLAPHRPDAAEILEEILRQKTPRSAPPPDPELRRLLELWPRLQPVHRRAILGTMEAMLAESAETSRKPTGASERRVG